MQFIDLPLDMVGEIMKFSFPERKIVTKESVKSEGREYLALSLVSKDFYKFSEKKLETSKKKF